MKKLLTLVLSAVLIFSGMLVNINSVNAEDVVLKKVEDFKAEIWSYDLTEKNTIDDKLLDVAPIYLIYPDQKVDEAGAKALLEELNIVDHINKYASFAYVVNPLGDTYDNEVDKEVYLNVINSFSGWYANVKVIGIGSGATFVNDVVAPNSWCIAGIMTYGGTSEVSELPYSIPAYLHGATETVSNAYIKANNATETEKGVYVNEENKFEKVIVSAATDEEETLAQAFENAWDNVFSQNYRMYNAKTEWFMMEVIDVQEPYELVSFVDYDKLGITVNNETDVITEDATKESPNQWYEYIPSTMDSAENGTVPLVIMLHGYTNDNRMQPETSGWVEKAAEEGFMCIAPEWQASGNPYFERFTPLGEDGVINLIGKLEEKYPQIDASRIYMCGCSAGAINSYNWGMKHTDIFAAVQGSSAPGIGVDDLNPDDPVDYEKSNKILGYVEEAKSKGIYLPAYFVAGTADSFQPIPVSTDMDRSYYSFIKAYCMLNDIDAPEIPDLTQNEYFGIKMDDQKWDQYYQTKVYTGTLSNDEGIMIKAVAMDPYAHWNNKQIIDDVWAFFSQYSRNPETGNLIIGDVKESTEDSNNMMPIYLCGGVAVVLLGSLVIFKKRKSA